MLLLDLSLKLIEIQQFSASNVNQTEWYLCCIFHFGRRAIWLFVGLLPFSVISPFLSRLYLALQRDCTIKFGLTIKFISFSICSGGSESRLARTFVFIHFRFDSSSQFNRCSSSSYVYCIHFIHWTILVHLVRSVRVWIIYLLSKFNELFHLLAEMRRLTRYVRWNNSNPILFSSSFSPRISFAGRFFSPLFCRMAADTNDRMPREN